MIRDFFLVKKAKKDARFVQNMMRNNNYDLFDVSTLLNNTLTHVNINEPRHLIEGRFRLAIFLQYIN